MGSFRDYLSIEQRSRRLLKSEFFVLDLAASRFLRDSTNIFQMKFWCTLQGVFRVFIACCFELRSSVSRAVHSQPSGRASSGSSKRVSRTIDPGESAHWTPIFTGPTGQSVPGRRPKWASRPLSFTPGLKLFHVPVVMVRPLLYPSCGVRAKQCSHFRGSPNPPPQLTS